MTAFPGEREQICGRLCRQVAGACVDCFGPECFFVKLYGRGRLQGRVAMVNGGGAGAGMAG